MMINMMCACLLMAAVTSPSTTTERVTLVNFRTAAGCAGARLNAWGGSKCGTGFYDEQAKGFHLIYTNICGTFSSAALSKAIRALLESPRGIPDKYYISYRGNHIGSATHVQFVTEEPYTTLGGFRRDGQDREISMRPGGYNAKGTPFEPENLTDIYILPSGTGDLVIYEMGAIYRPKPKTGAEDPTPVDVDAVRLFPEPRIWRRGTGEVALATCTPAQAFGAGTAYAAGWFNGEMRRFYGATAFTPEGGTPIVFARADTPEGRAALADGQFATDYAKVRYDGFAIAASGKGITVIANDPMGVMNGVRALALLLHQGAGDAGMPRLAEQTIVDWPRLRYRMLHQMMSCYYHANRYEPDDYASRLEKFPLGARFNLYSFELAQFYRYESVPGTGGATQSWDGKDFAHVVDRLNAAGAMVSPYVQSPGHQAIGLFSSRDVRPELREDGHADVMCTRHPETYPFLFGVFDEVSRICAKNPGYRTEIFGVGGDEVRWKQGIPDEKRCPRCRGIPYNRLFADHMKTVNKWMTERGYQMLMASDMIVDNHNGMDAFKCSEIRDELPTNIAYLHWAGMDFEMMGEFAAQGHDNWKLMTGYQDDPEGEAYAKGYGLALYNYNWWLSVTRTPDQGSYGLMAMYLTGELGWGDGPRYLGQGQDKAAKWGNFLMRNWSRKPIPHAAKTFATVALDAYAKQPLGHTFDACAGEVAHVPMQLARDAEGDACGVLARTNAAVQIALNRQAASLVFLHTAHLPNAARKFLRDNTQYRDWTDGPVIATVRVRYADGTSEKCEMRYGSNVGECEPGPSRRTYLTRYLPDARFVCVAKGGKVAHQYEWVNPHPERVIASLVLEGSPYPVRYLLLALTARDTRL